MTVTLDKSHELKGNGYLLGVGGENESEQLVINIAYDLLLDKWAYIEFEQNGNKHTTERLTIANGQIVYTLTNSVLVQGHIDIQVVFRDASGFVWKSNKRQFLVSDEINATEGLPEKHPDFMAKAQALLDEITVESNKVDAVLTTEEARVAAEAQRAENEATRLANETKRKTTEEERKAAETARATAEAQRQANEAGRVDAETARRSEFSGWANSLGNLNTYDKRLINLEEAGVGTLFDYVTDDTTAYIKTVPANALPYARLNKVGNAVTSVKSFGKNLFDANAQIGNGSFGVATAENKGQKITVVGNYFAAFGLDLLANETYKINFNITYKTNSGVGVRLLYEDDALTPIYSTTFNFIPTKKVKAIYLYSGFGTDGTSVFENIFVTKDLEMTAFEPYKATTYAIPLTDNYIKVEAGGSIVFENDNGQAVPSEIIYAVKK